MTRLPRPAEVRRISGIFRTGLLTGLTGLLLSASLPLYGQDAETQAAMEQHVQNKRLVWENSRRTTLIPDGKNGLRARSEYLLDQLAIDDNQAQLLSRDEIYQDSFRILRSLDAETWIPNKKGFRRVPVTDTLTTGVQLDNIFIHDGRQTRIAFPGVVPGARTRLGYSVEEPDAHFLRPFYFEKGYPVRHARLEIVVPEGVELGYYLTGSHTDKVIYKTHKEQRKTVHTWEARDMPRRIFYADSPPAPYLLTHLIPFVKSMPDKESGKSVAFLGSPDNLFRYYSGLLGQLRTTPSDSIRLLAKQLAPVAGSLEGAANILHWVRQHVRYVAFESGMGGFVPREADDVMRKRYGDCKDMSNLTVMLLRAAGYEAAHGWTGTTDLPYSCRDVGSPPAFNHMVGVVRIDNRWVVADATDNITPLGVAPYTLQGKEVLFGTPGGSYEILQIKPEAAQRNRVQDSVTMSLKGAVLSGSIRRQYQGLPAYRLLNETLYMTGQKDQQDFTRRLLSRGSNKLRLLTPQMEKPPRDRPENLTIAADFELEDYARQVGKEYFVNMNLLRNYEDEITPPERTDPIQYKHMNAERQVVVLQVPQGYKVSYLPEAQQDGEPGLWNYRITYRQAPGKVILTKEFAQDVLQIKASSFARQNALVKSLRQAYQETVVLTPEP